MESSHASDLALPDRFRVARRRAGLTQAALAGQVGCTQSAISMMEGGRWSALGRSTLEKIAQLLEVPLPTEPADGPLVMFPGLAEPRICPSSNCPSNFPYCVDGVIRYLPSGTAGAGRYCPLCGEVLLSECAACGRPMAATAACCGYCGEAYVPAMAPVPADPAAWVTARQRQAERLAAWAGRGGGGTGGMTKR